MNYINHNLEAPIGHDQPITLTLTLTLTITLTLTLTPHNHTHTCNVGKVGLARASTIIVRDRSLLLERLHTMSKGVYIATRLANYSYN
jgi:hypothetical protein